MRGGTDNRSGGPEEPLKTPGGSLPDNDLGIQNVQIRTGRAVIGLEQTAAYSGGYLHERAKT